MKLRPSPALVVAVLALVVALGGTSYAAAKIGSPDIKNNSIKSTDIKDNSLKGKDVKDGSLDGKDVADGGLTGADVADGSLTRADLTLKCAPTDQAVAGVCIDTVATGPTSYFDALKDCDSKGGRLMTYPEFLLLRNRPGVVWANGTLNQFEFIDFVDRSGANVFPVAVDFGGGAFGDSAAQSFWHRCVTLP